MVDTKTCTQCGNAYPATREYFYANRVTSSGLHSWCKKCFRADVKQREKRGAKAKQRRPAKYPPALEKRLDAYNKMHKGQGRYRYLFGRAAFIRGWLDAQNGVKVNPYTGKKGYVTAYARHWSLGWKAFKRDYYGE